MSNTPKSYSPTPGTIKFRLENNETRKSEGHPPLLDCMELMKNKDNSDEFQLINKSGFIEARIKVEHDRSIDNLLFVGRQGFKYLDKSPEDNPNKYFDILKDGKLLNQTNPDFDIVRSYLMEREYFDSIEPESANELVAFIQGNESFDNEIEGLVEYIKDSLDEKTYVVKEALDSAEETVSKAEKMYNASYGTSGEQLFKKSTLNQAVLKLVVDAEIESGYEPKLKQDNDVVKSIKSNSIKPNI
jgi:hypothetical protein